MLFPYKADDTKMEIIFNYWILIRQGVWYMSSMLLQYIYWYEYLHKNIIQLIGPLLFDPLFFYTFNINLVSKRPSASAPHSIAYFFTSKSLCIEGGEYLRWNDQMNGNMKRTSFRTIVHHIESRSGSDFLNIGK